MKRWTDDWERAENTKGKRVRIMNRIKKEKRDKQAEGDVKSKMSS